MDTVSLSVLSGLLCCACYGLRVKQNTPNSNYFVSACSIKNKKRKKNGNYELVMFSHKKVKKGNGFQYIFLVEMIRFLIFVEKTEKVKNLPPRKLFFRNL
jgi:hypothetical protein